MLVVCRLFEKHKRKVLVLNIRDPQLCGEVEIGEAAGSMSNGITALQSCGRFVVVDGGQRLQVVDVTSKKCVSSVESVSRDFFCCTEDRLVILGQVSFVPTSDFSR